MFFYKNSYCIKIETFFLIIHLNCLIVKKSLIFLLIIFFTLNLKSQTLNIEPGFTLGTSYYLGDINHTKQFYSPGLAVGLAFRNNFNTRYAAKLNIIRAVISGNDADFPSIYQQTRAHSFVNTLYEIGLQTEFNFKDFNSRKRKSKTPYITAGVAFVMSNSFQSFTFAIPMGVGYKYSPSKKVTLSAEWAFRNTISDNLDLLEPADNQAKQITKKRNNDWYSILGLTLTYNFQSDKKWCPAYQKKGAK